MNEKTLYAIGGSILVLSLGYFGYKLSVAQKQKEKAEKGNSIEQGGEKGGNDDNTQSSNDPKQSKDSFPLKIESFGYKVQLLQSALNKLGASLTVDGRFGEKTYDAIWDYADLPWYAWRQTLFSRINVLSKDNYEQILANATQKGWVVKNAEDLASESWLPFVQRGDDWSYNNLRM